MKKQFIKRNIYADINDPKNLENQILKIKPQILFHLAAQPLVSESFLDPLGTLNTNVIGTSNILSSIKKSKSLRSIVIITTDKVYKDQGKKKYSEEYNCLAQKACAWNGPTIYGWR